MINLWTFGDSFTAGHGCLLYGPNKNDSYYEKFKDYIDPNREIWPTIVAKKYDFNLINKGSNGATNDLIIDLILKNLLNFKKGDIVVIQSSTSMRFDLPFIQRNSLFGEKKVKSKSNRNYLLGIEDSPSFFKTIFTTNILDDFKNVGKNALMVDPNQVDKSLIVNESKYNLIKDFFSEFVSTKKFYERELWRISHISNIIESLGVKVYLINEDMWSNNIEKPYNLIDIGDVSIITYLIKNKLTILHDTGGKINDYHPSYGGHEYIAKKIIENIE
jgi:hypothetical protein